MEYRGFDIVKKKSGLYWVACNGSVLGTAVSVEKAKQLIDELVYED